MLTITSAYFQALISSTVLGSFSVFLTLGAFHQFPVGFAMCSPAAELVATQNSLLGFPGDELEMNSLQQIWVTIETIVCYHGDGGTVSSAGVLLRVYVCVVTMPHLSSFPRLCDSAL